VKKQKQIAVIHFKLKNQAFEQHINTSNKNTHPSP